MKLRAFFAIAIGSFLLMACPGPIEGIPPPTPVGVELALNAAIEAEHRARQRCPRTAVERGTVLVARTGFDARYGPYLTREQRLRLDEARSDTDRCGDP